MVSDSLRDEVMLQGLRKYAIGRALRYQLGRDEGEEAFHEVIVKLLEDRGLLGRIQHPGYIRSMIDSRLIDVLRAPLRRRLTRCFKNAELVAGCNNSPEEPFSRERREELAQVLLNALGSMKGRRRSAMVLWTRMVLEKEREVPLRSVAKALGVSVATVCRARQELQRALERAGLRGVYFPPPKSRRRFQRG